MHKLHEHLSLANQLKKEGQIENAIDSYQKAIQLQPDLNPTIYVKLGDLLGETNRFDEAISCYQTASYKMLVKSHPDFVNNHWNEANKRQPNFLIIGVGKGGTTSLYNYMIQHPKILPAIRKEIGISGHKPYQKSLELYLSHFPPIPSQEDFLTGEAGTGYFITPVAQKVKSLFPNVKIIVIFRNPVERFISEYNHHVKHGQEKRSIEEIISSQIEILSEDIQQVILENKIKNWEILSPGYLVTGLYIYFLKRWMSVFPREQFLILQSENFFVNPQNTLKFVFDFLKLQDYQLANYTKYNTGNNKASISENDRRLLSDFFRPYNYQLEDYLNMSFHWD
ncbi:MAG: sulfotransferase domain-containing protein [Geitlerinemataceae cyanobacterium]